MSSQLSGHSPLSGQIIVGHQLTAKSTAALAPQLTKTKASPHLFTLLQTNNAWTGFWKESAYSCFFFVTMTAWPTRLMRAHWKVFARGPKVSFSSCSDGSMKSRAVCSLVIDESSPGTERGGVLSSNNSLFTTKEEAKRKMKKEKEESWIEQKGIYCLASSNNPLFATTSTEWHSAQRGHFFATP